ncbi:hypothetical protein [Brazilian marseillevirus]|uniref:hypothetical protein n=1 Tax=Brazilian marseillevirus TaxID=1813599 RepID=UPI0007847C7C|nr:hypothetical protein A3303_gp228 [Brazilian marseillevirus]AMQ10736.1 hypothetical protein [Brazilian marseillevirus]
MERFLKNRELVTFSLATDCKVSPDDFVKVVYSKEKKDCFRKYKSLSVLPDGTRHGFTSKMSEEDSWAEGTNLTYHLGKLHGKFTHFTCDGLQTKCTGVFKDGMAQGTFLFTTGYPSDSPKRKKEFSLSFRDGRPIFFQGESRIDIIWKGDGSLTIKDKTYTRLFFSEENHHHGTDLVLGMGTFSDSLRVLTKHGKALYGTDKTGRIRRIWLPVFR